MSLMFPRFSFWPVEEMRDTTTFADDSLLSCTFFNGQGFRFRFVHCHFQVNYSDCYRQKLLSEMIFSLFKLLEETDPLMISTYCSSQPSQLSSLRSAFEPVFAQWRHRIVFFWGSLKTWATLWTNSWKFTSQILGQINSCLLAKDLTSLHCIASLALPLIIASALEDLAEVI